jgi:ankyrin repeat protein
MVSGIASHCTLQPDHARILTGSARNRPALHWAARFGHTNCMELLMEAGADPNARLKSNGTTVRPAIPRIKARFIRIA